jgi:hypothetical protein
VVQAPNSPEPACRGASAGDWFAQATLLLVSAVFVLNNLAPYLGLHWAGAMTMFSGLAPTGDNHFFMPKVSLSDADDYVSITQLELRTVRTRQADNFKTFVAWAKDERRRLHLNLVRYQISRVCQSAPGVSMQLTLQSEDGHEMSSDNACAEPAMLQYSLITEYPECQPDCLSVIRKWAIGQEPAE